MRFVLANACVSFDLQFCRSVLYPHFSTFAAVYTGNRRNARLEMSTPMTEVRPGQHSGTVVSCVHRERAMLARNGKVYVGNTRRYYDSLWPFTASYLAVSSMDAKDFGLIQDLYREFSRWGKTHLHQQYIQPKTKFMRKINQKIKKFRGKKSLMLVANLTLMWVICWVQYVFGWHVTLQMLVNLSK